MRISEVSLLPYALPIREPLAAIPAGIRRGWLLRVTGYAGRRGTGECAPLPTHGSEPPHLAEARLQQWSRLFPGYLLADAADMLDTISTKTPAARAALECALLDLAAQVQERPLWQELAPRTGNARPAVNALAGKAIGLTPEQIATCLAAGFTVIKLKLGCADASEELSALRGIAARLPPGIRLRLDANGAWDERTAHRMCTALSGLPVESLEEPLATPTTAALRVLQRQLPFPLALDENWQQIDEEEFFTDPPVRRLVLKLACQGGLLPALATAERARTAGIDCVVTTGIDSACGTLAAAHLAAALDNGLAHGLATSSWLAADTGAPPAIAGGRLMLPGTPGLGFVAAATRPT